MREEVKEEDLSNFIYSPEKGTSMSVATVIHVLTQNSIHKADFFQNLHRNAVQWCTWHENSGFTFTDEFPTASSFARFAETLQFARVIPLPLSLSVLSF